jgi:hypothetical protein
MYRKEKKSLLNQSINLIQNADGSQIVLLYIQQRVKSLVFSRNLALFCSRESKLSDAIGSDE